MKRLIIFCCALFLVFCNSYAQNKTTKASSATTSKTDNSKRLKVGLVLGGGGAKGAAEVGVLKYIEEAGIPIDYIAGTSIGSIIGGLYSCGYRSAELDTLFHNEQWLDLLGDRKQELKGKVYEKRDGVTYVFGFPVFRNRDMDDEKKADIAKKVGKGLPKDEEGNETSAATIGLLHGDNVIELLDSMTGKRGKISFDKLPIPFHCVAVDIRTMNEVELKSGSLPHAMRASMAIPGVFKPIETDSMLLVDGGLLNNLPVDVVKRMGADVVIAIDLTQNKHDTKDDSEVSGNTTLSKIVGWIQHRPDLKKYNENRKLVDVYINPELKGYSAASFTATKIDDMIKKGKTAGSKALKELKALKTKIYSKR